MDINSWSLLFPNQPRLNGNYFTIFHQNIRSLREKHQELLSHLFLKLPQVLCFSEHHLKASELQNISIDQYTIGAQYCKTSHAHGGVVIYTHNSLHSAHINLSEFCMEKDIEICAVKLKVQSVLCIITVYRSPSGNFNHFLETLDAVLQLVYSPSLGIIICGDININYLVVNEQRKQLDNLLRLYNLVGIVDFPTRLTNTSSTAIDNVFIDMSGFHDYVVMPFINGLSDHDAQILALRAFDPGQPPGTKFVRKLDQHKISDFLFKLGNESWPSIFNTDDVNFIYNSFLNTYLKIFHASFPLTKVTSQSKCNQWITVGIQTSCK
jgi:hypothetical protein